MTEAVCALLAAVFFFSCSINALFFLFNFGLVKPGLWQGIAPKRSGLERLLLAASPWNLPSLINGIIHAMPMFLESL